MPRLIQATIHPRDTAIALQLALKEEWRRDLVAIHRELNDTGAIDCAIEGATSGERRTDVKSALNGSTPLID